MDGTDIRTLRDIYARNGIVMSFSGPFSQTVIEELGQAIRAHLESRTEAKTTIADVFSVYIEMTQNIWHYAEFAARDAAERSRLDAGTVLIAIEDDAYAVISGNTILREHVPALRDSLDRIVAMDAATLKDAYKATLRQKTAPDAVGAGLGLLQMARMASKPLDYSLSDVDDDTAFFTLSVRL